MKFEKSKSQYVPPHELNGYKFTTKVRKKSSNHWKKRASHFNKQVKTDADMMLKVKCGHSKPERFQKNVNVLCNINV